MAFNQTNWYWVVGNRAPNNIFALNRAVYVAPTDPEYVTWLTQTNVAGNPNRATNILCDGELAQVLVRAGLPAAAIAAGATSLGNLSADEVVELVAGYGCAMTSSGTSSLDATYEVGGQAWDDMMAEANYLGNSALSGGDFTNGTVSLVWPARSGPVTFSPAQFLAVVSGLAKYLSAWKLWAKAGMSGSPPAIGTYSIA